MISRSVLVFALCAPFAAAHAQDLASGTWVDLTHPLNEQAVFWPTAKMFELETVAEGRTEGGYFYSAYNFSAAEHGGTHLDAPVHFAEGRLATDEIPVEQLIGPAAVIDIRERAAENRDYQIGVEDVTAWEEANGPLPAGAIVLFNTGFARFYPDRERYMGTAARGAEAVADLHFPGIHPELAQFLA